MSTLKTEGQSGAVRVYRTRKGRRSGKNLSARVAKIEKTQKAEMKSSIGYHFAALTSTSVTSAGAVYSLTSLSQGDSGFNRTGNQVGLLSISVRWVFRMATSDVTNQCRVMIFQDRNPDGVTPPISALLQSVPLTITHTNPNNNQRFNVLRDVTISLSDSGAQSKQFQYYKRWKKPLTIKYPGAGTIPSTHGIFMLVASDSTAIPDPTIVWESKMCFSQ